MTEASQTPNAKWPLLIGVVSLIYGLLFGVMYVRPPAPEASWLFAFINTAIAVVFSAGGVGVILRARWGVSCLLYGSYVMLAKLAYSLITIFAFMGGTPPMFALLAILTMMVLTAAWPVFLIIWLRKDSVKQHINQQWTRNAS
jgi:hypothetical protein